MDKKKAFINVFEVDCLVNNVKASGHYDSAADKTVMSGNYCKNNNIKVYKSNGTIQFADLNYTAPLYLTEPVIITIGKESCKTKCAVLKMAAYDILIGKDIMSYSIKPFKAPKPGQVEIEFDERVDTKLEGIENQHLKGIIKKLLEENYQLTNGKECTFPNSKFKIELKNKDDTFIIPNYKISNYEILNKLNLCVEDWINKNLVSYVDGFRKKYNSSLLAAKRWTTVGLQVRGCLDLRRLNEMTIKYHGKLPTVKELFNKAVGNKYYSIIDLRKAYFQIGLTEDSKQYTGFTFKGNNFCWNRAPLGLKNMPFHFQTLINTVLKDIPNIVVLIDDILVYSNTLEENEKIIRMVIERLNKYNLTASPEKSKIGCRILRYMGHIISQAGVQVDDTKLFKINDINEVKSRKQLSRILGFTGYFRDNILDYASLTDGLHELTSVKNKFKWNDKYQSQLVKLFAAIKSSIVLTPYNDQLPLKVCTDASILGIGGCVFQDELVNGKIKRHIIGVCSRKLRETERKYTLPQKEALAVYYTLESMEGLLRNIEFELYTDNSGLAFVVSNSKTSALINRWYIKIFKYNFVVFHIEGVNNGLADSLSRLYINEKQSKLLFSGGELVDEDDQDNIKIKNIKVSEITSIKEKFKCLSKVHSNGHFGLSKMTYQLRFVHQVNWKNMVKDIKQYINACHVCNLFNSRTNKVYHELKAIQSNLAMDHLMIDWLDPGTQSNTGKRNVLVVVDVYTRYCWLFSTYNRNTETVLKCLMKLMLNFGIPNKVQKDNAKEFIAEKLAKAFKVLNIKNLFSSPYHPRANGLVERYVGIVKNVLKKYRIYDYDNWDKYLNITQYIINTHINKRTGLSPYNLMFGRTVNYRNDGTELNKIPPPITDEQADTLEKKIFNSWIEIKKVIKPNIKDLITTTEVKSKYNFR